MNLTKRLLILLTLFASTQLSAREVEAKNEAIRFDYNFSGATRVTVEPVSDFSYRVKPVTETSGSQFFYVCFRIDNFHKGDVLPLELAWLPASTASYFLDSHVIYAKQATNAKTQIEAYYKTTKNTPYKYYHEIPIYCRTLSTNDYLGIPCPSGQAGMRQLKTINMNI